MLDWALAWLESQGVGADEKKDDWGRAHHQVREIFFSGVTVVESKIWYPSEWPTLQNGYGLHDQTAPDRSVVH